MCLPYSPYRKYGYLFFKRSKIGSKAIVICTPSANKRDTYDGKRKAGIDAIITFDKLMDEPQFPILVNKQFSLPITNDITVIGTCEYVREIKINDTIYRII